jgi:Fe-S cluster assembly scaffold protein SufB
MIDNEEYVLLKKRLKEGWKEEADSPTAKHYIANPSYPEKQGKIDEELSIKKESIYTTVDTFCSYVIGSGKEIKDLNGSSIMPYKSKMEEITKISRINNEENLHNLINKLYLCDGSVVKISPKTSYNNPIEILTGGKTENTTSGIRHYLSMGELSSTTVTYKIVNNHNTALSNIIEVDMDPSSTLNLNILYEGNINSLDYLGVKVEEKENATLNLFIAVKDSGNFYSDIVNTLQNGAYLSSNSIINNDVPSNAIMNLKNVHAGHNSTSNTIMKSVSSSKNKVVLKGNITIENTGVKSSAELAALAMLFSEEALANVLPTLTIKNNDVHAKHKASVEKIDEEKLFYIMSRGINLSMSQQLFKEAFTIDILSKLKDHSVKRYIEDKWYHGFGH